MQNLIDSPLTGGVRFAPSPTGTFHLGNLRTAWVSERWARALGLPWVVRFEDIDTERVVPEAQRSQSKDMRALGLVPDEVIVQSESHAQHFTWFAKARAENVVYPCDCSRKDVQMALQEAASAPHGALPVYTGKCRDRDLQKAPLSEASPTWAWRFRCKDSDGRSDFIVARTPPGTELREGSFAPAYHWACALDDHFGAYRLLVRAADLSSSAPLQRVIQEWLCKTLGLKPVFPAIFHTSLVVQDSGARLEKRTRGVTLAELLARGRTPAQLVAAFAASFDAGVFEHHPESGEILGESAPQIPLSRLDIR